MQTILCKNVVKIDPQKRQNVAEAELSLSRFDRVIPDASLDERIAICIGQRRWVDVGKMLAEIPVQLTSAYSAFFNAFSAAVNEANVRLT